ncbi:xylem serine peptidase 1 [Tasmannia lanceolata]|uniref:xylem serine peptidase 1 n=1 Tax=Tasmannia lanceolata TaxID=3420 RepID=UPI004063B9E5
MNILENCGVLFISVLLILSLGIGSVHGSNDSEKKLYIVYMGDVPKIGTSTMEIHRELLYKVIGEEEIARDALVHSYQKSFNAFAARLRPEEATKLSGMNDVVSVFPSSYRKLHTTRSWDYIGFHQSVKRNLQVERDIVIGMMDTGIWAHAPSFHDKGIGPPPAKWKGKCVNEGNFTGCNNKIIGAKYFRMNPMPPPSDEKSPADIEGHGTHTASTAAGATAHGASFYGLAKGTARGAVPSARIAMYKVCWSGEGCYDADILAGFDEAIADGVDLISCSLGGFAPNYFEDPIAIGAFHAMRKGIITSTSAGNDGPFSASVVNTAPWLITVGATTMDRQFKTKIRLGNGMKLLGTSINTFSPKKQIYPLIRGADAANRSAVDGNPSMCEYGTLDKNKVKGKIVYCEPGGVLQDESIRDSGGAGAIIPYSFNDEVASTFVLPLAVVSPQEAQIISSYINSSRNPEAVIYKSRTIPNKNAPFVASFSSRGPSSDPFILKPDITAPGVDILAAYTELASVTGTEGDNRILSYNILTGTSMACPHVTGAAAYVKSIHPHWSPAAIKSALITTANHFKDKTNTSVGEFGYGAGQVDPARAADPGLVYDMNELSYIGFLCKEGVNSSLLKKMTGGEHIECSDLPRPLGHDGLNYPSMQVQVPDEKHRAAAIFRRRVTNVGTPKSVYKAIIKSPKGLSITVTPDTLRFNKLGQQISFKVVIKGEPLGKEEMKSGSLIWSDSRHKVRSPIVLYRSHNFGAQK